MGRREIARPERRVFFLIGFERDRECAIEVGQGARHVEPAPGRSSPTRQAPARTPIRDPRSWISTASRWTATACSNCPSRMRHVARVVQCLGVNRRAADLGKARHALEPRDRFVAAVLPETSHAEIVQRHGLTIALPAFGGIGQNALHRGFAVRPAAQSKLNLAVQPLDVGPRLAIVRREKLRAPDPAIAVHPAAPRARPAAWRGDNAAVHARRRAPGLRESAVSRRGRALARSRSMSASAFRFWNFQRPIRGRLRRGARLAQRRAALGELVGF